MDLGFDLGVHLTTQPIFYIEGEGRNLGHLYHLVVLPS